jgi:hypothetical protein
LGAGDDFDISGLPEILSRIESDQVKRRCLSLKGREIVDGGGLERVAQIIRDTIGAQPDIALLEGMG